MLDRMLLIQLLTCICFVLQVHSLTAFVFMFAFQLKQFYKSPHGSMICPEDKTDTGNLLLKYGG